MNSNIFKYVILPLVLFIAAIAMFIWVIWPLYNDMNAALDVKQQNETNLAERQKLSANLEKLIAQYNERTGDITSFAKVIPTGQNLPALLVNLEAIASENGLRFQSVDFKQKDFNAKGIKTLIMDIRLKGAYPAFHNYVAALEKSLRLFDVISISFNGISPGVGQERTVPEYELLVNTYFQ
jgi:Tfp pilus assembly protein PilO